MEHVLTIRWSTAHLIGTDAKVVKDETRSDNPVQGKYRRRRLKEECGLPKNGYSVSDRSRRYKRLKCNLRRTSDEAILIMILIDEELHDPGGGSKQ